MHMILKKIFFKEYMFWRVIIGFLLSLFCPLPSGWRDSGLQAQPVHSHIHPSAEKNILENKRIKINLCQSLDNHRTKISTDNLLHKSASKLLAIYKNRKSFK